MAKYIRTLTVFYDTEISDKEIPLFRGAVLKSLGDSANELYHNHTGEETFRYSYPLIQYKRLNRKAAIVCIDQGIELVGELLLELPVSVMIGTREEKCHIEKILTKEVPVSMQNEFVSYRLHRWLPLNSTNYALYQDAESLVERIHILERVLIGNILSFLKGVDIHLEKQLELHITNITNQKPAAYKKVKLMAFDIEFKINLSLPQHIGIGKNASVGYGILTKITI